MVFPAKYCDFEDKCSHDCYNAPEGYICGCPENMYLQNDNVTCSDTHRCEVWGICSQKCVNVGQHSHKCTCFPDYEIQPDHFSCKSVGTYWYYVLESIKLRILKVITKAVTDFKCDFFVERKIRSYFCLTWMLKYWSLLFSFCLILEKSIPQIIFSNRHELRRMDLDMFNVRSLTMGLKNTVALDFFYSNNSYTLFWTDVIDDKIFRGTVDETG